MQEAPKVVDTPDDYSRKQWKYVGYRGFCDFVASDNDFFILRRFSKIATRSLLALQDDLVELENQLKILEGRSMQKAGPDVHHGSFRQETHDERAALIEEMQVKLRNYYDLANSFSQLRSRPKAPQKSINSTRNWFANHRNAILEEETEYINQKNDLFQMVPTTPSPLRGLLERSTRFRLLKLWEKRSVDDNTIHYISDRRIDLFVNMVTTLLGLAMLISPLWILAHVKPMASRLAIMTSFIFIFLLLVRSLSAARPFEVLAATAAYAAVLVVFLQSAH
ncbi:hypothetical protein BDV96DRAFT_502346 [Lophiotrema nucula]|uniref:DUF6594 domain-containing protein n=1 Tax=Lophiotrema nucula TaxID=690887 RepID=A0A6A5YT23_9PLEO|nr:hypothetical protein BDV96DRAFT_502346 [Lophiotrema nucula]